MAKPIKTGAHVAAFCALVGQLEVPPATRVALIEAMARCVNAARNERVEAPPVESMERG